MEGKRVVCLGEALVDFVCERPVESLGEADFFVPRPGGSLANIAVAAARLGARVEMLGGAGDDEWGLWLRERLESEGVGVEGFLLVEGMGTSHAFVSVSDDAEPSFAFYGDRLRAAATAGGLLDAALAGEPGVLVVGSDTLLGAEERRVTMDAATLGRERGWDVLCDPNLRPNRWDSHDEMVHVISGLVALASVVKLNEGEALALSGEDDLGSAASWLLALGPGAVVITRGGDGASIATVSSANGEGVAASRANVEGVGTDVVDATGAGDSVAGVIAAGLARGVGLERSVGVAMEIAAGVVASWGATAGLPAREEVEGLLGDFQ